MDVPPFIDRHRDIIATPAFELGADTAMLNYIARLTAPSCDGNGAMANGYKIQGAMEFLFEFKMLAETVKPLPTVTSPKLDHTV